MRIEALPEAEHPRQRCLRLGVRSLSSLELLVLLLGSGGGGARGFELASSLLERFGSLESLSGASPAELKTLHGMGGSKSVALAAAFELGRRAARPRAEELRFVSSPDDAAELFQPAFEGLGQEAVMVLHLGARHQFLQLQLVALGGLNAASVEPREVFRGAIGVNAKSIVLAHNHPSGSLEPSEDDIRLTSRLAKCGQTLGVTVLDHLVIAGGRYVSLSERGLF